MNSFKIGEYFQYNKHICKVLQSENQACTDCIGLTRYASCKKLPQCSGSKIFEKQNTFQLRQLKKLKTEIKSWLPKS